MAGGEVRPTHTQGWYAAAGRGGKKLGKTAYGEVPLYFVGQIDDADTPGDVLLKDGLTSMELPKGFVPTHILLDANATGTTPTIDIGLAGGAQDALLAEADADAGPQVLTGGAAMFVELAADTVVTFADGASAATGGTLRVVVVGFMERAVKDLFAK
jgi:hypothetical protein